MVHLLDCVPALVLPVTEKAAVCAWSPWTVHQMYEKDFNPGKQVEELSYYLRSIISVKDVNESMRGGYQAILRAGLNSIVQSAVDSKVAVSVISKTVDLRRAGIVMFRF